MCALARVTVKFDPSSSLGATVPPRYDISRWAGRSGVRRPDGVERGRPDRRGRRGGRALQMMASTQAVLEPAEGDGASFRTAVRMVQR